MAKYTFQEALKQAIGQWKLHIEENEQSDIEDITHEEAVMWRQCNMSLERALLSKAESTETTCNNASDEILPQIDKILWSNGDAVTKVSKCKDLLAKLRT